ncbi:polysaccharide deacetylase family protein [Streptomyces mobaraensis]|uniref:polysaccharide deacetylase family protein n=1 Tax=Streptomyces mobaraensis TaxID=35621 RepID=UPI0033D9692C
MPRRHASFPRLLTLLTLLVLTVCAVLTGPFGSATAHGTARPLPPVLSRVPTHDRVVFLTIDDGWYRDPAAAALLRDRRIPVSLFPLPDAVEQDPGYFRQLVPGHRPAVGNHTVGHPDLTTLDLTGQRKEICAARDRLAAAFGRAPALLRRPSAVTTTPPGPRRATAASGHWSPGRTTSRPGATPRRRCRGCGGVTSSCCTSRPP